MDAPTTFLSIAESKSKELVPVLRGTPLHSLHNPRREAEVFANNHLAQLSRSPNVLVLGLGFGYHIEEMAKVLRLKHKHCRIVVVEAHAELVRLWQSYQKNPESLEVFTHQSAIALYQDRELCRFLLQKPVVVIHPASFEAAKPFYQSFLQRRAATKVNQWSTGDAWWDSWAQTQMSGAEALLDNPAPQAAWLRAFWELKHAE